MKKFTTIICTLAMLASLTACSSNETTSGAFTDDKQIVVNDPADSVDNTPESAPNNSSSEGDIDEKASGNTDSKPENTSGEIDDTEITDDDNSTENTDKDSTENKTEDKNEQTNVAEGRLPLKEYPAGSYFTYDGNPCTDHDNCSWDIDCNCVNFDNAIQSMGFAKYVYFQVTGRHVSPENKTEINADIDAESVKAELMDVPLGTYIAVTQGNDVPHFMIAVDTDENSITVYQANYGGGCIVSVMNFSWADFAAKFPHLDHYVK